VRADGGAGGGLAEAGMMRGGGGEHLFRDRSGEVGPLEPDNFAGI
jgi:hypothetical protein